MVCLKGRLEGPVDLPERRMHRAPARGQKLAFGGQHDHDLSPPLARRVGERLAMAQRLASRDRLLGHGQAAHQQIVLTLLLFLFALWRSSERTGRVAERLGNLEKTNDTQRRTLDSAARLPHNRNELADWQRDGRY